MYHFFHPCLRSLRTRMQTATSEAESKSRDISICMHHYTLRAPGSKGQEEIQHILISRHVRAIPWPLERWRARRRVDTGYAGRLHGRKHARGRVQPRCRGGGGVGRGKGCRRRRRSCGGPLAWFNAYGRGRHPAAQRTRERPTQCTGGPIGSTTARPGTSSRTGRWRQRPPTRRRHRSRRAGTIIRGSSWALRTTEVGCRAQLEAVGGGSGAGAVRAL